MSGEENGDRQTLMNTGLLASIHVSTFYFRGAGRGQNDANEAVKMSTIDLFLPNFASLGCEGSRGSHLTTRLFTSTAAADRPRAGMPAPISHT